MGKHRLKKIIKNNRSVILPSKIFVTRYTRDLWMKLFPSSNDVEWAIAQYPEDPAEYISNSLNHMEATGYQIDPVKQVTIVTLDEEYEAWANENNIDVHEGAAEYANQISEESATRLLLKNHMNEARRFMALPVFLFCEHGFAHNETEFVMSPDTNQYLKEYLEFVYQTEVYVAPYYVRGNVLYDESEAFCNLADHYFTDRIKVRIDKYQKQTDYMEGSNTCILYVPFFIREIFPSAKLDAPLYFEADERPILKRSPELACFLQEGLDDREYDPRILQYCYRKELDIQKIRNDIHANVVMPGHFPIHVWDIPDYEESFQEVLEETVKTMMKQEQTL